MFYLILRAEKAAGWRRCWWDARNDPSSSEGESFVLSPGAMQPARTPWDRKQAFLHQLVGYDLDLQSSDAKEGSKLVHLKKMYTMCILTRFGNTKCALQGCLRQKGVHKVCTCFGEHTFCTHFKNYMAVLAQSVLMESKSVHLVDHCEHFIKKCV